MERRRNEEITHLVESLGHTTYLPQRDGGVFAHMVAAGKTVEEVRKSIFKDDIDAIKSCDGILCLLDGRVPDEGMCIEVGVAYTLGKMCVGYRTDSRVSESEGMNIILEGVLSNVFTNVKELGTFLSFVKV